MLMLGTATLLTWRLDVSGYANAYYSAAAQAGADSWKAFLFGSLDGANGITVDKPPMSLWPMGLSVRAFGLSPWSILLPQAVEGVAASALLYACVRHVTRDQWPAVLGAGMFATMPVSALVFRYNNPDALLTLLLLGCAYGTVRAVESDRATAWLVLVGALAGLGYLTKMLEAFLIVPALGLTYLMHGRPPVTRRLIQLAAALGSLVAACGWWIALVELWPPDRRPFVGGSPTNSVLELTFGYNGAGRLTGSTGTTSADRGWAATNIARIGRTDLGGEVMWLVPTAAVLGALAYVLTRQHPDRRRIRASLLLWSTWFVVAAATFALMAGIFHSYYTVVLAPAIAAVTAIGAWLAWEHRQSEPVRRTLALALVLAVLLGAGTLAAVGYELRWWCLPIALIGTIAVVLIHPRSGPSRLGRRVAALSLVAATLGPVLFTWATVTSAHVGSAPMAGPGHAADTTELVVAGPPAGGWPFPTTYAPASDEVVARIAAGADRYRWAAATLGARTASSYQLAVHAPVLAIGGYKGTDPTPTAAQFAELVRTRQVHWYVPGGTVGDAGRAIDDWVRARFHPELVDGFLLYELTLDR
jgi:4-amino-4-deoxy-L-arabinose transferase-like glycosyltransferase